MAAKKVTRKAKKRGRKPETLKIEGDWQDAVAHALKRKRPKSKAPDETEKNDGPDA